MFTRNNISVQLPKVWTHCAWDSRSAFSTSIPIDVNQRFVYHDPPVTMVKPNQICLCIENETVNCHSETIGRFYPGEMVSTTFTYVSDDDSYGENTVSLFEFNTQRQTNFECRSKGIIIFHQTFNECTTVNYRIKHNNEHWCVLILKDDLNGLVHSAEQAYSRASLSRTPLGNLFLSFIKRCPLFRGL